jgi:hypothetical protein
LTVGGAGRRPPEHRSLDAAAVHPRFAGTGPG